jgi:DNA-binding transcriptional ArsR family regulator
MDQYLAVPALAALAQETRLDVFRLLVRAGDDGLPAGDIVERTGVPPATISFHLNQLRHAGLIRCRRQGRSLIYAAEYAVMNDLLDYLTENCCADGGSCQVDDGLTGHRRKVSKGARGIERKGTVRQR